MNTNYQHIQVDTEGAVARLRINRPGKRNALDLATIRELTACSKELSDHRTIRFVVLSGTGDHFCAGADLQWMAAAADLDYDQNLGESMELARLFATIFRSPKIFIATVKGACYGGGIGLAAACDLVIASDSAEFAFSEVRLGLVPATISPYVVYRMGVQKSKRLMLTGERKKAGQLEGTGLIDFLTCDEEIGEDTEKLIKTLLKGGNLAQQEIKRLLNSYSLEDLESSDSLIRHTASLIARSRVSDEGREGIKAFLEKRDPDWE